MDMKLENAIKLALEYESGVYEVYREAMNRTKDESAKRIFKLLCEEEMEHLKYLESRLGEWQKMGKIKIEKLGTSIPAREAINKGLQDLRRTVHPRPTKQILELELLKKALDAETKASNFYKEMVAKLDGDGRELFHRFVEIEEGHEAIVQAEIDSISNLGFWFDTPEFRLEAE
jgi:rubrerythrin